VGVEARHLDLHVHRQHRDVRDRREQQLLQPEHDLFHGPDFEPSRLDDGSLSGDFDAALRGRKLCRNPNPCTSAVTTRATLGGRGVSAGERGRFVMSERGGVVALDADAERGCRVDGPC
jgi:hypothetical protein